MAVQYRYRFGTVVFDEAKLELVVGGLTVEVQPRPLRILSLLLAHGGGVVTREEFFEQVWEGRETVENVLANAVTKLRNALGAEAAALIENVPRVGYRFAGQFERAVVGRSFVSGIALHAGDVVPRRKGFVLERILGQSRGHEVWLATHRTSRECRVYKFAADAEHVAGLKREATLGRLLASELGERRDIVRVIDWSFDTAPFFIESEYGGESLKTWAQTGERLAALTPAERLALFLQIADAVAAAHGVAVLHKDLKPDNILMSRDGEAWQPRLVDFGSGRLLEPERLAELGLTNLSATLGAGVRSESTRGTLMYLAPELLQDQPATARSDVYALGILLYQLMVGDLRRPLVPGWERDVVDELVRDDVARATDGDPARRTASVAELSASVRGLERRRTERAEQHDQQMHAERIERELRRVRARRPWLIATVASLVAGLAASLLLYAQVRATQQALSKEYAASTALNTFLARDFIAVANPALSGRRDVTVIEAASQAASKIDSTFAAADPQVRATLHTAMQQTLAGLSDFKGSIDEGRKALLALGEQRTPDARQLADVRLTIAAQMTELSQLDGAAKELDAVEAQLAPAGLQASEQAARLWWVRGLVASGRLHPDEALEDQRMAWGMAEKLPDAAVDLTERIALSYADANKLAGRFAEAELRFRSLLSVQEARYGKLHPRPCYTNVALANTLGFLRRADEGIAIVGPAAACLNDKVGPQSSRTVTAYEVLANLNFQLDHYAEAADAYAEVAQRYARVAGPAALRTLTARLNTAMARQYAGHPADAEREIVGTLEQARSARPETDPLVQNLRYHLADCRLDQHHTEQVAALLTDLSAQALNASQIAADWDGRLAYQRGRLALESGDAARAVPLLETAATIIAEKHPDGRISEAQIRQLIERAKGTRITASR